MALNLLDFGEDIIHHVAKFLPGKDLLNLSHTSRGMCAILQYAKVWSEKLKNEISKIDPIIERKAEQMIPELPEMFRCLQRLIFVMHISLNVQWICASYRVWAEFG